MAKNKDKEYLNNKMEMKDMKVNYMMINLMGREYYIMLIVKSIKEILRIINQIVKRVELAITII